LLETCRAQIGQQTRAIDVLDEQTFAYLRGHVPVGQAHDHQTGGRIAGHRLHPCARLTRRTPG
jgi:metallophosphoesterase superfamily enzyme